MKSVNIKGKEYIEVNERIKYFRNLEQYNDWSLESEILEMTERCVIKAIIKDSEGRIRATGIAYEKEGSTFINKTSYIENCETSAWGRALGNLGIGIDTSIATAEEVGNAIKQQESTTPKIDKTKIDTLLNKIIEKKQSKDYILKFAKVSKIEELTTDQFVNIMKWLEKK